MKKRTIILWAVVLAAAVSSPVLGNIVYSGSQDVRLIIDPSDLKASQTIQLGGMSEDWDDFRVELWFDAGMMGMPGMGMGSHLAIYAPRAILEDTFLGVGMGGILGLQGFGSKLGMGASIGGDSFFDAFMELPLNGDDRFGEDGGYIGLRTAMGQYGWLHMSSQSKIGTQNHSVVFDAWAYEDQPGVPLAAGQGQGCGEWTLGMLGPYKMHWPQLPDVLSDVREGLTVSLGQVALADDFKCTETGPVREVHFWGSFLNGVSPRGGSDSLTFELSIYADVPATEDHWSRPGKRMWSRTFSPGQYTAKPSMRGCCNWYDPESGNLNQDHQADLVQYDFCIEDEPFVQEEGTIYWLAVKDVSGNFRPYTLGWRTTEPQYRWNDHAVYLADEPAGWIEMNYPKGIRHEGEALDLSFVIGNGENSPEHDFGDAPDSSNSFAGVTMTAYPDGVTANFPTVYHAGSPPYGPMHLRPRDKFYLGERVSLENEADIGYDEDLSRLEDDWGWGNNLLPFRDVADQDGRVKDDGLVDWQPPTWIPLPLCERTTLDYRVTVTDPAATSAYVNVWFDWNRDGDWDDTLVCPDGESVPEWAVQNDTPAFAGAGVYVFTSSPFKCWHPDGREPDPLWMRITIAEQEWTPQASGGAGPAGGYRYGETEDYQVQAWFDLGDAPDDPAAPRYPTLWAHNGARHLIGIGGPYLGDIRGDPDPDGQPNDDAHGDDDDGNDDEDGVRISWPMTQGLSKDATVEVNGGGGVVQIWVDFNGDAVWEAAEEVFDGVLADGVHEFSFDVPADAVVGMTFARARISTAGGLHPDGPAMDGEVEDYEVRIVSPPPTILPGAVTACPAVETMCPVLETWCPPVETQCLAEDTKCPTSPTKCPPAQTYCPAEPTKCPPVQTNCPAEDTKCPPTSPTKCPESLTKCPPTATQCQSVSTVCPAVLTYCPAEDTKCPPTSPTKCPAEQTKCPPVNTQCPAKETQCPLTATECRIVDTQCPAKATRCPTGGLTACPTCGLGSLHSDAEEAVVLSVLPCPIVESLCPTIAEYLAIAEARR